MNPKKLLSTIYLGDRSCKGVHINSWKERVSFHIDIISRVREDTWNFYTNEDIADGLIVFDGVRSLNINGPLPNDLVNKITAREMRNGEWLFCLSIGSVSDKGKSQECQIEIIAADVFLESPTHPGVAIR